MHSAKSPAPPDELELAEWRAKFSEEARNTVAMTQPFKYRGEVCCCIEECQCIPKRADSDIINVDVLKTLWNRIYSAVEDDNLSRIQSLVLGPDNFPQMSIAMLRLFALHHRSEYVCSGDVPVDHQSHYSLNLWMYCHFTSPIRRYMDLVVHRLVNGYIDNQPCPFTQTQMSEICSQCTDAMINATRYQQASCYPFSVNPALKPVISNVYLKRKFLGGQLAIGWQASVVAYQPIANLREKDAVNNRL